MDLTMGFKLKAKTARIVFEEDSEYCGAEVEVLLSASMGEYLDVMKLIDADDFPAVMTFLASQLIAWNLEDDNDQPIPATYEGMMSLRDPRFVISMMKGWQRALQVEAVVDAPLAAPSSDGGTLASLS